MRSKPRRQGGARRARFTTASAWTGLLTGFLLAGAAGCGVFKPSPEELQAMGDAQAPQLVEQFGGYLNNPSVVTYVEDRGQELASVSGAVGQVWTFHVLDSDVVNAFALPGGHIFITRGMMIRLSNEAELMGVLGHEIGHVMAEHSAERLDKAMSAQVGLGVGSILLDEMGLGQEIGIGSSAAETAAMNDLILKAAEVATDVALLAYSREDEMESDKLGVQYMATLGYNPTGQIGVMRVLADMGAGGDDPEFLKTHPDPGTRIDELNDFIAANYPDYRDPARYRFNQQRYEERALAPLAAGQLGGLTAPDAVPSIALADFARASAWRVANGDHRRRP
ncbi:MAG: M48 family metalloprotease [Planctomycetota bacterium]